jgi:hypothetical protein
LAKIAKKKVPKVVYDYVEGSALAEKGYDRSIDAFGRVQLNNVRTFENKINQLQFNHAVIILQIYIFYFYYILSI